MPPTNACHQRRPLRRRGDLPRVSALPGSVHPRRNNYLRQHLVDATLKEQGHEQRKSTADKTTELFQDIEKHPGGPASTNLAALETRSSTQSSTSPRTMPDKPRPGGKSFTGKIPQRSSSPASPCSPTGRARRSRALPSRSWRRDRKPTQKPELYGARKAACRADRRRSLRRSAPAFVVRPGLIVGPQNRQQLNLYSAAPRREAARHWRRARPKTPCRFPFDVHNLQRTWMVESNDETASAERQRQQQADGLRRLAAGRSPCGSTTAMRRSPRFAQRGADAEEIRPSIELPLSLPGSPGAPASSRQQ